MGRSFVGLLCKTCKVRECPPHKFFVHRLLGRFLDDLADMTQLITKFAYPVSLEPFTRYCFKCGPKMQPGQRCMVCQRYKTWARPSSDTVPVPFRTNPLLAPFRTDSLLARRQRQLRLTIVQTTAAGQVTAVGIGSWAGGMPAVVGHALAAVVRHMAPAVGHLAAAVGWMALIGVRNEAGHDGV